MIVINPNLIKQIVSNNTVKEVYWDDYSLKVLEIDDERIWCYSPVQYILSEDKQYYSVASINKSVNGDITFASTYNNLPVTEIQYNTEYTAFRNCYDLTGITIPYGVTTIDNYAFMDCKNLIRVEIPSSVTDINPYTFEGCISLIEIVIPEGVGGIGERAFYGCSSLKNVVIGDDVLYLGYRAFRGCSNLESIVIGNGIVNINAEAFYGCTSLRSIYYNGTASDWNNITIESSGNSTSLSKATIYYYSEDHPKEAGNYWHYVDGEITEWCNNIIVDNAVAPTCTESGLTEGTHCGICGTVLITQETIPAKGHTEVLDAGIKPTCTETGLTVGSHCSVCGEVIIEQVAIPATGHSYESVVTEPTCTTDGYTTYTCHCGYSYVDDYTDALGHTEVVDEAVAPTCTETGLSEGKHCSVCGEILVAQEVVDALGHSHQETITKHPTCTTNGLKTFTCHCGDTYTEVIPATGHTESLPHKENWIHATCTTMGKYDWVIYCTDCGRELNTISMVEMPLGHSKGAIVVENRINPTCTESGSHDEVVYCAVCEDELSRTEVIVDALGHSEGDWIIDLAASCTNVGTKHTECIRCSKKMNTGTYYIPHNYVGGNCTNEDCGATNVSYFTFKTLEDGTYELTNMKESWDMPKNVVIPKTYNEPTDTDIPEIKLVTSIGSKAFYDCWSINSVYIPDSITSIGDYAFWWCANITSVVLPNSITSVGDYTFQNCIRLQSIVIPDNVTSIGDGAFYGCKSITNAVIGNNVTSIGKLSFWNCSSLTSVVIPNSVKTIDSQAFGGCSSLSIIYFDGTPNEYSNITVGFGNNPLKNANVYYYSESAPESTDGYTYWRWVEGKPRTWCDHTIVVNKGYSPTCTETGLTDYSYCSVCGEVLVAQEIIPANGHKYSGIITPPTCMHAGRIDYTCSCGDTSHFELIPKTNHKLGSWYWSASNNEYRRDCQYDGCDYYVASYDYEQCLTFTLLGTGTYEVKAAQNITVPHVIEIPSTHNGIPVTRIADRGFSSSMYLHEVIIPEGIEEIGSSAFFDCRMLGYDVVIPSSVSLIESNAFGQCDGIRTITFAKADGYSANTHIQSGAFSDCHGLEELNISSSVTHIEEGAFEGCYGLKLLLVEEGNPIYHSENNCIIETDTNTVVLGCKDSKIPDIVHTIGSVAFGTIHQASIKIPISVEFVEALAFPKSEGLVVYCEATSKPAGWADNWCDASVTVVWGYVEDTNTYLVTEDGAYLTDEQGRLLII